MNIKTQFNSVNFKSKDIDNDFIRKTLQENPRLSNKEERFFNNKLSEAKKKDYEFTVKSIKMYAIWGVSNAIKEARKRGAFRYSTMDQDSKKIARIINALLRDDNITKCMSTKKYLSMKKKMSWIFEECKMLTKEIRSEIYRRHEQRQIVCRKGKTIESALFKELLTYLDSLFDSTSFSQDLTQEIDGNLNVISNYSKEEIAESVSYLIFLYKDMIGIDEGKHYFVDPEFVRSYSLEKLILRACKLKKLEEYEILIDSFGYSCRSDILNNRSTVYCENENLEKSIRNGYIRDILQSNNYYHDAHNKLKDNQSLADAVIKLAHVLEISPYHEIADGVLSRYRFEITKQFFGFFKTDSLFKEEHIAIAHLENELLISFEKIRNKQIIEQCTIYDVLIFQRYFLIIEFLKREFLFTKSVNKKVLTSLVPICKKSETIDQISNVFEDKVKVSKLLDFFTYEATHRLDIQYTPFIEASKGICFSNAIVATSNLMRNAIALSNTKGNIKAQEDGQMDRLEELCAETFRGSNYTVETNCKYSYNKEHGEIDVVVINEHEILLIECKCPLTPISPFEMRTSHDYIEKASSQLDLGKRAFCDSTFLNSNYFIKKYKERENLSEYTPNIRTCIIMGSRLFSGYRYSCHPIRYIYELENTVNRGEIQSNGTKWTFWDGEEFAHEDLIRFLDDSKSHIFYPFKAMVKHEKKFNVGKRKIVFKTFLLDVNKLHEIYCNKLKKVPFGNE